MGGGELDSDAYGLLIKTISNNKDLPSAVQDFFITERHYSPIDYSDPRIAISSIRKRVLINSDDAYLWLELARNYLILGSIKQSEKALLIARTLSPNNRLIIRSLMRFYHHINEIDKALFYVRSVESFVRDPMLLSGEIALCNTAKRSSKNIKIAKNMLQSQNYEEFSLSELRSEIGTMEIMNGKDRIGKRLLEQSLETPTENAVAQSAWINQCVIQLPWIEKINRIQVANNYEGVIYLGLAAKGNSINWELLFSLCQQWSKYQPFSRNPVYLGGNIASDFLEDYQQAFDFSKEALSYHKDDAGLLNNIAYAAILKGDKETAERFLKKQLTKCKTDEERIVYLATKGLFEFRFGNIEQGKVFYSESTELAKAKSPMLYGKALIYYFRELDRANCFFERDVIRQLVLKQKDLTSDIILFQLMRKFRLLE